MGNATSALPQASRKQTAIESVGKTGSTALRRAIAGAAFMPDIKV
jgi:hypothetical protein